VLVNGRVVCGIPFGKLDHSMKHQISSTGDLGSVHLYEGYSALQFKREGRILYVAIAHEKKKNAVDAGLHRDLARVFYEINLDTAADVVVLTGTGRWFCAGGDMTWFQELVDEKVRWRHMVVEAKKILNGLLELEKPIIAKINGAAAGLGASIALLCDIVYASDTASIGDPHVKMGLVAGDGGAVIWPHLIGINRAKEMLLTGRMLPATEAHAIGLINHVVSPKDLDVAVDTAARELAAGATLAIRWTKTVLNLELRRINAAISDSALAYETLTNDSADHQEAVNAFVQKRAARFTGA